MILALPHGIPIFQMTRTGFAERDAKGSSFTLILLLPMKWPQMQPVISSVPEPATQRSWMLEDFPGL